jgi:hypothetical protein
MSAAAILAIIQGIAGAIPELLSLYDQVKNGQTVTEAQVQTVLGKYTTDRVTLVTDIAASGT